jgi:hypothetical protein
MNIDQLKNGSLAMISIGAFSNPSYGKTAVFARTGIVSHTTWNGPVYEQAFTNVAGGNSISRSPLKRPCTAPNWVAIFSKSTIFFNPISGLNLLRLYHVRNLREIQL